MLDRSIYNCHFTDTGNAKALSLLYGDTLVYIHGNGWHIWNGKYWIPDNNDEVFGYVKELSAHRQRVINRFETSKHSRNSMLREAYSLENSRGIENCLKVAKTMKEFSISPNKVDNNQMLITCPNGTVDLESGNLRQHDPKDLITNCTNVDYNPEARAPLWNSFLQEVFVSDIGTPDYQLVNWLQKVFGYALTGDVSERSMYIFFGEGANGKSTLLNMISYVMGSYAGSASFSNFLETKNDNTNDIASLRGKRLVGASETGPGKFLDEVKIKQLTGGDKITCRYLYKEYFSYYPTYKIFLSCNDKPKIKGSDNAIWDRMVVVPFNVRFNAKHRDKHLFRKLKKEAEGILVWMIEGCIRWQIEGLEDCKTVRRTTDLYRTEEDPLSRFLTDKTKKFHGAFTTVEELWRAYSNWAKANGEPEITNTRSLGRMMGKKNYCSSVSAKSARGYRDIEIV